MSSCENLCARKYQMVYCSSKYCLGVPIEGMEENEDLENDCPICLEPLINSQTTVLLPCQHQFCKSCVDDCTGKLCPFCRTEFSDIYIFNKPIKSSDCKLIKGSDHQMCIYPDDCPYIRNYLTELKGEWARLVEFMFNSQINKGLKDVILGVECLDILKLRWENRMISKKIYDCCFVCKTPEGKTQVIVAIHLNNLVMRLAVLRNEDVNIEADNEYADEIVGYINVQLEACWKAFPRLLNRDGLSHTYVRKFENVTGILFITGYSNLYRECHHKMPMSDQLMSAKLNNFHEAYDCPLGSQFPRINFKNTTLRNFNEQDCCDYEAWYATNFPDDSLDDSDDADDDNEGK